MTCQTDESRHFFFPWLHLWVHAKCKTFIWRRSNQRLQCLRAPGPDRISLCDALNNSLRKRLRPACFPASLSQTLLGSVTRLTSTMGTVSTPLAGGEFTPTPGHMLGAWHMWRKQCRSWGRWGWSGSATRAIERQTLSNYTRPYEGGIVICVTVISCWDDFAKECLTLNYEKLWIYLELFTSQPWWNSAHLMLCIISKMSLLLLHKIQGNLLLLLTLHLWTFRPSLFFVWTWVNYSPNVTLKTKKSKPLNQRVWHWQQVFSDAASGDQFRLRLSPTSSWNKLYNLAKQIFSGWRDVNLFESEK